jgi:hypothetical protein
VLVVDVVIGGGRVLLEATVVDVLEDVVILGGMSEPPCRVDELVELDSEVTVIVDAGVVVTSVVSVLVGISFVVVVTWIAVLVEEPGPGVV